MCRKYLILFLFTMMYIVIFFLKLVFSRFLKMFISVNMFMIIVIICERKERLGMLGSMVDGSGDRCFSRMYGFFSFVVFFGCLFEFCFL